uniref:Uncharacterized protein n=1 Tax=Trichogramma kaykai TaxID=54128 RepID=A0ABD2X4B0_9HYME
MTKQSLQLCGYGSKEHLLYAIGYSKCTLSVDGVIAKDVPIWIVEDSCQPMSLIVGRTYTELPHIQFANCKDTFTFAYDGEQITQEEPRFNIISAAKSSEIMPNSVNFICINDGSTEYNVPLINFSEQKAPINQLKSLPVRGKFAEAPPLLHTLKASVTEADITVADNEPAEAKEKLLKILNEYRDTIAMSVEEIGQTGLIEMDIKEVPGSKPVNRKPYLATPSVNASKLLSANGSG